MEVLTNDNWLLTVGTFLPLVGVVIMMFISDAEETLHKQIAIVTSGATLAIGVWTLVAFDYGQTFGGGIGYGWKRVWFRLDFAMAFETNQTKNISAVGFEVDWNI